MNTYWKKRFSWSKSRQGLLEECPQAYYYNYIGRYEFGKEGDSIKPLLKLQKSYFFKGSLIHSAIRNQITQSSLKRPLSLEAARNFVDLEFKRIANSQAELITEAYNGFPLEDDFLNREKEDSLYQLSTFFTVIWHNYKELRLLTHERLESFLLDGIKVWVQPDLVTKNLSGDIIISDWKTGRPGVAAADAADTDLQLSVYITWAGNHFGVDTERIAAELVYLKIAQTFPTRRTKAQIDEVKEYIKAEAAKMLSVKTKEEFIARPGFRLCKGCNFATICPDTAIKDKL